MSFNLQAKIIMVAALGHKAFVHDVIKAEALELIVNCLNVSQK